MLTALLKSLGLFLGHLGSRRRAANFLEYIAMGICLSVILHNSAVAVAKRLSTLPRET